MRVIQDYLQGWIIGGSVVAVDTSASSGTIILSSSATLDLDKKHKYFTFTAVPVGSVCDIIISGTAPLAGESLAIQCPSGMYDTVDIVLTFGQGQLAVSGSITTTPPILMNQQQNLFES